MKKTDIPKKITIMPAEPYRVCELGSFGRAKYMLLRQFQFPSECYSYEEIVNADSDRARERDRNHFDKCYQEFGITERSFESLIQEKKDDEILTFLKKIMKVDEKVVWTGFRIMGSVSGSGYAIFSFELFAKDPKSNTKVYTGEDGAPNVRSRK